MTSQPPARGARSTTGAPSTRPARSAVPTAPGVKGRHRQPTRRSQRSRRARVLRGLATALAMILLVTGVGGYLAYRHLSGNISVVDTTTALGTDRPAAAPVVADRPTTPTNILLIGSDTREGAGNDVGGDTPGLSDTTILLHLSADRTRAEAVSIPRDSMVERPTCLTKDGTKTDPGGMSMFNAAYAIGGPACTQRTVEQLTGVRVDHFVVVDFAGFQQMVDALGGVSICVPKTVTDSVSGAHFEAGTYSVAGQQALDYVRIRHAISDNGDIGRIARQQAFLASMAREASSSDTITNPTRLYSFLNAATQSLTTDPGLGSLSDLASLARQMQNIGLDKIQFLTVPWQPYAPDPNRVAWSPEAEGLWQRLARDEPLTADQAQAGITAAGADAPTAAPSSTVTPAPSPPSAASEATPEVGAATTPTPEVSAVEAAREQDARNRANGLCSSVG